MKRALLAAAILVLFFSGVVLAADLVVNGDFSAGVEGWSPGDAGSLMHLDGGCGPERAKLLQNGPASNTYTMQQCIVLPEDATSWVLRARMGIFDDVPDDDDDMAASAYANFYNSTDCTGDSVHEFFISTTEASLEAPFSATSGFPTAGQAQSVLIRLLAEDYQDPTVHWGCFDDVVFGEEGTVAVTLGDFDSQESSPLPWSVALIVVGLLLPASLLVLRRR